MTYSLYFCLLVLPKHHLLLIETIIEQKICLCPKQHIQNKYLLKGITNYFATAKKVCSIYYECNPNVLHSPCCYYHVTYQCQLHVSMPFIHKSSPVALWDSMHTSEFRWKQQVIWLLLAYSFMSTVNSNTSFIKYCLCLLYSREVCDSGCSLYFLFNHRHKNFHYHKYYIV